MSKGTKLKEEFQLILSKEQESIQIKGFGTDEKEKSFILEGSVVMNPPEKLVEKGMTNYPNMNRVKLAHFSMKRSLVSEKGLKSYNETRGFQLRV